MSRPPNPIVVLNDRFGESPPRYAIHQVPFAGQKFVGTCTAGDWIVRVDEPQSSKKKVREQLALAMLQRLEHNDTDALVMRAELSEINNSVMMAEVEAPAFRGMITFSGAMAKHLKECGETVEITVRPVPAAAESE